MLKFHDFRVEYLISQQRKDISKFTSGNLIIKY